MVFFAVHVVVPFAMLENILQFVYHGKVTLREAELVLFKMAAEALQIKGLIGMNMDLDRDADNNEPIDVQQTKEYVAWAIVVSNNTDKDMYEPINTYSVSPKMEGIYLFICLS